LGELKNLRFLIVCKAFFRFSTLNAKRDIKRMNTKLNYLAAQAGAFGMLRSIVVKYLALI